jgi:uncharacterized protein YjbI with pentapeptide repeats
MLANAAVASLTGTNTGDQDLSTFAPLASPALTGSPTAPTPEPGTNNTRIATTAFVTAVATAGTVDADGATKGKIQLAGDLTGTAALPAIAASAVTTAKIADANVTAGKIAADAVTTAKILDANVTTAKIADANVTGAKIAADAVTTAKILDANVTTAKIADANVTAAKIAADAVTTAKILDANVTTAKIADASVTSGKLADDAVTTVKILDANVTGVKIAADAVTTAKIANGAVTLAKQADIATASLLGRTTAAAGAPEVLTATAARTLLALENVSNTSDANKPVSNATQTALDLKAPLESPTFTGTVSATSFGRVTGTGARFAFYENAGVPYTITVNDYYIKVNSNFSVTLPSAVGIAGQRFVIYNNTGTGYSLIATTSSQTITGNTYTGGLPDKAALKIFSDGANWLVE